LIRLLYIPVAVLSLVDKVTYCSVAVVELVMTMAEMIWLMKIPVASLI
jgi:hypothetical protein